MKTRKLSKMVKTPEEAGKLKLDKDSRVKLPLLKMTLKFPAHRISINI